MRSQICAEIIVQAFRGFITFLILVHHRFSDAYNKMNVAVGSERGYRTLDLHPKASQNSDLRGASEWYRKDSGLALAKANLAAGIGRSFPISDGMSQSLFSAR